MGDMPDHRCQPDITFARGEMAKILDETSDPLVLVPRRYLRPILDRLDFYDADARVEEAAQRMWNVWGMGGNGPAGRSWEAEGDIVKRHWRAYAEAAFANASRLSCFLLGSTLSSLLALMVEHH